MLVRFFVLLTIAIPAGPVAGASRPRCSDGLERSLGVEWEYQPIDVAPDKDHAPASAPLAANAVASDSLARSNFRKLFAFFGRSESGDVEIHVVPERLVRTEAFGAYARAHPARFERRAGRVRVRDWAAMPGEAFLSVVAFLLGLRGRDETDLVLRKIPEVWADFDSAQDRRVPDRVAEEWRLGRHFVNLEFPMNGGVGGAAELAAYLGHLWSRLGLVPSGEPSSALGRTAVHVHWVPTGLPRPGVARAEWLGALVGLWGDANDAKYVFERGANLSARVGTDGRLKLRRESFVRFWNWWQKAVHQGSIRPLMQSTFARVVVTDRGITVRSDEDDVGLAKDALFPPVFKRLAFGLRAIYGTYENSAVPKIGIEVRNEASLPASLGALSPERGGSPSRSRLIAHASPEVRGLVDDREVLRTRARSLGLDPRVIDQFESTCPPRAVWRCELLVADAFSPLGHWLAHPLAKNAGTELVALRVSAARARWVERLNELLTARMDPAQNYRPEWAPEGIFVDDRWFQAVVVGEQRRFYAESGLVELLQPKAD